MSQQVLDGLEFRTPGQRALDLATELPEQIAHARDNSTAYREILAEIDPEAITTAAALADLPVTRKTDLMRAQAANPPFGGYACPKGDFPLLIFQSPGPIYEPGVRTGDWWRVGRFLRACGISEGDIVLNCMSYHLTPAGMMVESAVAEIGATVMPAGTGQSELQAQAAAHAGATAYAGTPDHLKAILDRGDAVGLDLSRIRKAAVGGGALFPSLRQEYEDRGIACLQFYGTADVGSIAYESPAMDGMIVDDGVVVEIVTPGTGIPVEDGKVGELVVTTLNKDYPLVRFATGDLSAIMPGTSPCGRTNKRIKGWMGRADQTAKVKGMFVRPEQIAKFVEQNAEVVKARATISRVGQRDKLLIQIETKGKIANTDTLKASAREILKLNSDIAAVVKGTLPNDGKVIDDQRDYERT